MGMGHPGAYVVLIEFSSFSSALVNETDGRSDPRGFSADHEEQQRSHLTRALSSQRVQRRATNVSVKSFLSRSEAFSRQSISGDCFSLFHLDRSSFSA